MESPSTPAIDYRGNTGNFQKSHYRKTVCLADWWLVKTENEVQGRRLAVAGISEKGKQAVRMFTSAPILKSFDGFTLETTDGIYVVLNGFINKTRTLENGFPSDIFNYFLFGFPPQWREYDEKCVGKEPPSEDIMRDKHLDQLTQQLGSTEGAQPHVDSCEKDLKSQGEPEDTDRRKSKRAKCLGVALPKRCSLSGLQKESYSGGTSIEDDTALKLPVKCLLNEDTGIREIKTRSKTRKANNTATKSPCTPAASITIKPQRTPKSKKKKVWSPSPESQSVKRSRSGRLLMPKMEYWRNQRAIYDADRTITGIDDGKHP